MLCTIAFPLTLLVLNVGAANWQDARVVGRHGSWSTLETVDPIDDSVRVVARAEDGNATLALVCDRPDEPPLLLVLAGTYIDGEAKKVVYRVDKNPPIEGSWSVTFQGSWSRVAGMVSRNAIRQMRGGSQVVIRTWTATDLPETATFSLAGFTNATRPVLAACAWAPTEKLARERAEESRRMAAEKRKRQEEQRIAGYNARAVSEAPEWGSKEYEGSGVGISETELHEAPTVSRPLPKRLAAGDRVQILRRIDYRDTSTSWFFVQVEKTGDYGWVLDVFIREDAAARETTPTEGGKDDSPVASRVMATLGQPFETTATVSAQWPVPLFAAPGGFSQDRLGRALESDAIVRVLRRATGHSAERSWYLVELKDGYQGWLSDIFLDLGS